MDRLERARTLARERGIDALLITPGADLRYLTGYAAKPLERLTCLVVRAEADPVLVAPALEVPAAEAAGIKLQIASWDETQDPFAVVASLLGSAARIAVDDQMWAARVLALREVLPAVEQVLAGPLMAQLRMRKDAHEIESLRRAGQAIDSVHSRMGQWLRPGRTEREIGRDIARGILDEGHVSVDFVIVGSGPNGASPHHELSDRVVQDGDPVVVDIGGTLDDGYCSDSTRNYLAGDGPAPDGYEAAYEVLLQAQAAQRAHARPGVSAESVDLVGRNIIADAGYGELFIHRTGHGIGVQTHEEPYIVAGNALMLEPGMAFSIEPGIYVPGRYGARIEDIVVCTENGLDVLNNTERRLVRLA